MSERKITNWALPHIKNFRTYIDIGANVGKTSIPFVDKFQNIHCFEPNPETFKILSKNERLICYNIALGSAEGETDLIVPKDGKPGWGSTSILRNKNWTDGNHYRVLVKTLDSFKFLEVDFIKIDVEQAEMDVILGSIETIQTHRPVIMFENKRQENNDVSKYLESIGYKTEWHKSDTLAYYKE